MATHADVSRVRGSCLATTGLQRTDGSRENAQVIAAQTHSKRHTTQRHRREEA